MKRVQAWLIAAILFVLLVKLLWWVVQPMIPLLVIIAALVWIFGFIFNRRRRW